MARKATAAAVPPLEVSSDHLTPREIAADMKCSVYLVRRRIRAGELHATNIGSPDRPIWRITRADYERYKRRNRY